MDKEAERQRLNRELAQMFEELGPILDKLRDITAVAKAENWDMERFRAARADLQAQKEAIGVRIQQHQGALTALDAN